MNNNKTRATKNVNVIEMVHILYWVGMFNQTIFHPDIAKDIIFVQL